MVVCFDNSVINWVYVDEIIDKGIEFGNFVEFLMFEVMVVVDSMISIDCDNLCGMLNFCGI